MGYIYKITNTKDGKAYIGQTTRDVHERWKDHLKTSSNCTYLKNAINKHGKEFFKFEILIICFDESLNKFESEYINKYNTIVPNGYNLSSGGDCNNTQHEETKRKISCTLKVKKRQPGYIHSKPQLGKPHSPEVKAKISRSLKNRILTKESLEKRTRTRTLYKVVQSKDGIDIKTYDSVKEVMNSTGLPKSSISSVCNNKRNSAGGFQWRYVPILHT
jgi:group I intron endonuclease